MLSDLYDWLDNAARRTPLLGPVFLGLLVLGRRVWQFLRDLAPAVVRIDGRLGGAPVTLRVLGDQRWVAGWVAGLLSETTVRSEGRLVIFGLPAALGRWRKEAAFTAVHLGSWSHALWRWCFDLTLPRYASSFVRFGPEWPDVRGWARNVRRLRRGGFVYRVTRDSADIRRFYRHLYLPTMRVRHGPGASVVREATIRYWAGRGGLLLVERDGEKAPLGGVAFEQSGRSLLAAVMGVAEGDLSLYKEGVGLAIYFYLLTWARQQALDYVDLGGNPPILSSSHLFFKSRWGATLARYQGAFHRVGLAFAGEGAAREGLCRILAASPLIFEFGRGLGLVRCLGRRAEDQTGAPPGSPPGPLPGSPLLEGLEVLRDLDCSTGAPAERACPLALDGARSRQLWRKMSILDECSR
jgi:hypothetical protein